MDQLKGVVHPLVLADQEILTPFPVCIHNLNHVSVSVLLLLLTLRLSCLPSSFVLVLACARVP